MGVIPGIMHIAPYSVCAVLRVVPYCFNFEIEGFILRPGFSRFAYSFQGRVYGREGGV